MTDRRNSRFKRLAKEGSWIVAGQAAAVVGALVLVRVLTERLDPAQYGQLALGLTVAGLVNQTVLGGISAGIARHYSIACERLGLRAYLMDSARLLGYATIAVVIVGLTVMVNLVVLGYPQWLGLVAAAIIFSLLSGFTGALNGIQNAARQRAAAALNGGIDAWLRIGLAVAVMLLLGANSTAVVIGYCCSSFVVLLWQFFMLQKTMMGRKEQPGSAGGHCFLRQMWDFSWPFSAWGIFSWLQQASDRWALAGLGQPEDVGLYAVLSQLGYAPVAMVTTMAMTFLAPILYQRSGDASDSLRNAKVHRLAWEMTFGSLVVTVLGGLTAFVAHEWLFRILVSAEYRHVSHLLPWMVMAGGIFAAGQILALKLLSEMKSARMATAKIVTALLGVAFNVYGASVAGLTGVVAALLAFAVVYLAWMMWLACERPHLHGQMAFMTPGLKSEE